MYIDQMEIITCKDSKYTRKSICFVIIVTIQNTNINKIPIMYKYIISFKLVKS